MSTCWYFWVVRKFTVHSKQHQGKIKTETKAIEDYIYIPSYFLVPPISPKWKHILQWYQYLENPKRVIQKGKKKKLITTIRINQSLTKMQQGNNLQKPHSWSQQRVGENHIKTMKTKTMESPVDHDDATNIENYQERKKNYFISSQIQTRTHSKLATQKIWLATIVKNILIIIASFLLNGKL